MAFERRLGASLLILLGALPLLFEFLPARPELLIAPLAVVACATSSVLAPVPRVVQVAAAFLGALTIVLFDLQSAPASAMAITCLVPLVLAVLGLGIGTCVAGLVLTAALGAVVAPDVVPFGNGLGAAETNDWVGTLVWAGAFVAALVNIVGARVVRSRRASTLEALDAVREGIDRDHDDLLAITRTLADPELVDLIGGHGLGEEHLNLATSLDDRTVLLARIDGEPLATLSVGWALRTCAMSSLRNPELLRALAVDVLDEIVAPEDLRWVALLDLDSGRVDAAPGTLGQFAPAGPAGQMQLYEFADVVGSRASVATLAGLVAPMSGVQEPTAAPQAELVSLVAAGGLAIGLAALVSGPLALAVLALPWLCLHLARRHRRLEDLRLVETERTLEDRIDCGDDIHHQIARHHGGLLPYQIELGGQRATAHRLRGEVLDGSFADMLVARGRGLVLAGEVSGEGIAARFVGMAAQMAMRTYVQAGMDDFQRLRRGVRRRTRETATRLDFPVQLAVGMVELQPSGLVTGHGTLADMVVVDGTAAIRGGPTTLLDHARVYLTPASSRPGPEDSVPILEPAVACARMIDAIEAERWNPTQGALASLFSLVFDGVAAPAHGTLIELSSVEAKHDGDAEQQGQQDGQASERMETPLLAAI